jgi:flagellar biosynthetic protein FliP
MKLILKNSASFKTVCTALILFLTTSAVCAAEVSGQADLLKSMNPSSSFLILTLLSLIPLVIVAMTTFIRNVIVLSIMRQALGLQQTPPNIVIILLSVFLMLIVMGPTFDKINNTALQPYLAGQVEIGDFVAKAWEPLKAFMITQTHQSDIKLIYELSKEKLPVAATDIAATKLIPAFMLSELKVAFQIGFVILLPFLVIDIIVASILMSLGMIMVPPVTISLPIKLLLFLLIDGWSLLFEVLIRSTY